MSKNVDGICSDCGKPHCRVPGLRRQRGGVGAVSDQEL